MMRNRFAYILHSLFVLIAMFPGIFSLHAQVDVEKGGQLFNANCTACHALDYKLVGPALANVNEKYAGDEEWLYKWIRNAPGLIASGDEKAIALWEANNKLAMNAYPQFSDDDIGSILAWVKAEEEAKDAEAAAVPVTGTDGELPPSFYYALLGVVALLLLIALVLVVIMATMVSLVRAKEQKEPVSAETIISRVKLILQNKLVIGAIATFVLLGGTVKMVVEARTIGLHQGYMPEQPIAFSHKIHAGEYEIDCQYCHSGVTKSKSAWIPSVNVCMNCHKGIRNRHKPEERHPSAPGAGDVSPEIAKIYKAIGWDAQSASYIEGYEPKAIEWVRIHNLPDHAYFNHAQHVVVGNLECQTCHGPIEEMEVVYQYNTLGMGWCISCHREEKVKVLGEETDYTVEDMGGLECARCHY